ncbi:MAG: hypothetical protein ABFC85_07010 [Rectinema sp.]
MQRGWIYAQPVGGAGEREALAVQDDPSGAPRRLALRPGRPDCELLAQPFFGEFQSAKLVAQGIDALEFAGVPAAHLAARADLRAGHDRPQEPRNNLELLSRYGFGRLHATAFLGRPGPRRTRSSGTPPPPHGWFSRNSWRSDMR